VWFLDPRVTLENVTTYEYDLREIVSIQLAAHEYILYFQTEQIMTAFGFIFLSLFPFVQISLDKSKTQNGLGGENGAICRIL
jgi:hypothetical protein